MTIRLPAQPAFSLLAPPEAYMSTTTPLTSPATSGSKGSRSTNHEAIAFDLQLLTLDRLGILPWVDHEHADQSEDPRSAYVETFWLPIIGPSTTLLLRRLADDFDAAPDGFEIDCVSVSREIGLGTHLNKRSAFVRTLDRCVKFNMAQITGDVLYVRRRMPRLRDKQVAKLSERLQVLHASWTLDTLDDGAKRRTELVRATHLARTLLALGGSTHDTERQLHQWHFHPSIAWHAVQWAQSDPAEPTDDVA